MPALSTCSRGKSPSKKTARRYGVIIFKAKARRLLFRIDGKMSVNGSASEAVFHFSDIHEGTMKLTKSAMTPQLAFDEKNLNYIVAQRGATCLHRPPIFRSLKKIQTPFPSMAGSIISSCSATSCLDSPYRAERTFFNYSPTEQLVFDVDRLNQDYAKAYSRSYSVLNSFSDFVPGHAQVHLRRPVL